MLDLAQLLRVPQVHPQFDVSPADSHIAFAWNKTGEWQIYEFACTHAQGGPLPLTSGTGGKFNPRYAPDGTRLAFTSRRMGVFEWDIFVYDLVAGSLHQLTDAPGSFIWPNWSSSGDRIIYRFNDDNNAETGLYMMRADGSDARELLPEYGYGGERDLMWLP